MAAIETIDIDLIDVFPGTPGIQSQPSGPDVFTEAAYHNVAAAGSYPKGEKIRVRNHSAVSGKDGDSILMYGQFIKEGSSTALAAGSPCGMAAVAQNASKLYYVLTNDDTTVLGGCAIALSAMTTARYGWFWVGGVCPAEFITALRSSTSLTDGNVTAAAFMSLKAVSNDIGLAPATTLKPICGFSWLVDA